jgi:hypothetical protein
MRLQRPLTLIAVLALAAGLSSCGSDGDLATPIPKTSPDLTVPTGTTAARPADTTTPTTTTATSTTPAAVTPPPAAAPPATPPPAAAPGSATTGGQAPATAAPGATGQSTTGGTQAGGGAFENFCAQNPGAC